MLDRHWETASDEELLRACRHGDTARFSLLWDRHRRPGIVAARSIAPSLDAEDLVSDAYLKIFELVCDGRGPQGAFRPYMYQVIRTIAADKLRSPELASADLEEIPDLHETGPWEENAFDLNAVSDAFSTLNPRWQAALWYTEVEGMPPREAAPLLGVSANSASALAARARDALKSAWVEAHANRELAEATCRSTIERLQRYQRGKLTARASREVAAHLDVCESCEKAAAEFSLLNHQLGLTLATVFLGSAGAAALLGKLGVASVAGAGAGAAAAAAAGDKAAGGAAGGAAGAGIGVGVGGAIAIAAGVVAAGAAIVGGAVMISNATAQTAAEDPEPVHTEQTADTSKGAPDRDARKEDAGGSDSTLVETDAATDDDLSGSGGASWTDRAQPSPPGVAPITPPVIPPVIPPGDGSDPALAVSGVCKSTGHPPEYVVLEGEAVEKGVVRVRITQGTTTAMVVPDFSEFNAPSHPGDLWKWRAGLSGGPPVIISLTPLSQWGLVDDDIANVTVELRFITMSGHFSPWTLVDASASC